MYILLVSVAVKHVLDEVLDHVTHITGVDLGIFVTSSTLEPKYV